MNPLSGPLGRLTISILKVIAIIGIVIGIVVLSTGLTTPLLYISTGSMEPNINAGDMVVLSAYGEPTLLSELDSQSTISETNGTTDIQFAKPGDVIVYKSENVEYPVVHRVHDTVSKGEDWVTDMDSERIPANTSCKNVPSCPAPVDGYITAGDDNNVYDQISGEPPVSSDRIMGTIEFRLPYIGRLSMYIDSPEKIGHS